MSIRKSLEIRKNCFKKSLLQKNSNMLKLNWEVPQWKIKIKSKLTGL